MKIFRLLSWTLAVLLGAVMAAPGEELQVVVAGRYHEPVTAYRAGGRTFINAKQAGELYGGQVYWYPISGRVQMTFRSRRLQFVAGSEQVLVDEKTARLEAPVMLRAAQAYVPLSFFLGPEFSALCGMESQFNERTRLLTIERHSNVGPVRWFSYQDHTRVVLELKRPLSYGAAARGLRGVEVTIPFGVIETPEQSSVGDGLVEDYVLRQDAKLARLTVRLAKPGLKWRVRELSDPRRLAVDVAVSDLPPAGPAGPPAPISAAAVAAEVGVSSVAAAPAGLPAGASRKRLIVIDPGHGGRDSGANGRRGTVEKDINLAAAKELAERLKEDDIFEVLLTRGDDTFIPLADRSRLANEAQADLFVSLHCNAARNRKENGFEVYFLSERASDPEAERLAQFENSSLELEGKSASDAEAALLLRAMTKTENINAASELAARVARALHKRVDFGNRGVKQAAFYVLRGTDAPAVLVEMAFLSNRRDEAKLESSRYRRRIIDGLYAGLIDHAKSQGWLQEGAPPRSRR